MKVSELQESSVMDLASSPIETLAPEDSVAKVIGFMKEAGSAEAFVAENSRTAIVTLRDLLKVQSITMTKLSNVMSYVPRLNPNNNVGDAAALMFEHRIRSLPIYRGDKPVGKIDAPSIISRLVESLPEMKVSKLMTPDPITIDAEDDMGKARRIMMRRRIDQIPVTRERKLDGVIGSDSIVFNILPTTDRDNRGDRSTGRYEIPVRNYTYADYPRNGVSDSIKRAFESMRNARRSFSVITMFDDEIQGIVTHRDYMKILSRGRDKDAIPMYLIGLPEDAFEAEAARDKFTRIVNLVRRAFPETLEARAIIKAGETKAARKRYRVQIFLMTPQRRYNYTAFGYELPNVFDEIEKWAKKVVARTDRRPRRTRADPGAISGGRGDMWVR